jgi:hypothetical protein
MGNLTKRIVLAAAVLGTMASMAGRARGDLVLTMSVEGGGDLTNLTVGQTETIDVTLSGLVAPTNLSFLNQFIFFSDPTVLSATTPVAGSIVPNPGGDFTSSGGSGASGVFVGNSTNLITTNGIFFSFQVTALKAGSGTLTNNFDSAEDSKGTTVPLGAINPLSYHVTSVVAPEPSTLAMIGSAVPLGIGWWLRRRRRAA